MSGWDQSNVHKSALGPFLQTNQRKRIPASATLIVESFARLSSAEPLEALGIFTRIIQAGLNIVTLTNSPKVFSRETVKANTFQLFEALIEMNRAHGESERKSQFLEASWRQRYEGAVRHKQQ